jgi:hypothetical protein
MTKFQTQPTPNPNSRKITTEAGPFADEMASFGSAEEAEGHALGEALFGVAGIENVLILPDFVTVTKTESAEWKLVTPKVERILSEHFDAERS